MFKLLFVILLLFSCGESNTFIHLKNEIKHSDSTRITYVIDTFSNKGVTFYIPISNFNITKKIIKNDIKRTEDDPNYKKSITNYMIKQESPFFCSILKSIYVEDGSAKGYSAWNESLVFFEYNNTINKVNIKSSQEYIMNVIRKSIDENLIDNMCVNEGLVSSNFFTFYVQQGDLYINNPIDYPVCWVDLKLDIDKCDFQFTPY